MGAQQPARHPPAQLGERRGTGLMVLGMIVVAALALVNMVTSDPGEVFAMLQVSVERNEAGLPVVRGTVHNRADAPYANVEFQIRLLGEDGRVVAVTSVSAETVAANGAWTFEAPILSSGDSAVDRSGLDCKVQSASPRHTRDGLHVLFACTQPGA